MKINPSENVAIVPFENSKTSIARSKLRSDLVKQDDTNTSKNSFDHESRQLRKAVPLEKGSLLDIYA